jgi:chromosome segregation ATPase
MGQVLLDFRAKVQDQTIEINNLHTENEKLVNEKRSLAGQFQGANQSIATLDAKVKELDQKLNATTIAKEGQIQQVTRDRDSIKASLEAKIKGLESEGTALKGQVSALTGEKAGLLAEQDDLNSKVAMNEQRVQSLESQLGQATQSGDSLSGQVGDLQKQVADLTGQLGAAKTTVSQKEANISAIEGSKNQLAAEVDELKGTVSSLENTIAAKDAEIQKATAQLEELNTKVAGQGSTISEQEAKIKELEPATPESEFHSDSRIICPMCGNIDIKNVEDKTRVLSYVGHVPIYAKKHICKKCSYEFT